MPDPLGPVAPPPLTPPAQLAAAEPGDRVTVTVASPLTMVQPDKMVAAPVAPPTGNVVGPVAVVQVVPWSQSKIILTALTGLLTSCLDAAINVGWPILLSLFSTDQPLNWTLLGEKLARPLLVAVGSAAVAWWHNRDNRIVGTPAPKP